MGKTRIIANSRLYWCKRKKIIVQTKIKANGETGLVCGFLDISGIACYLRIIDKQLVLTHSFTKITQPLANPVLPEVVLCEKEYSTTDTTGYQLFISHATDAEKKEFNAWCTNQSNPMDANSWHRWTKYKKRQAFLPKNDYVDNVTLMNAITCDLNVEMSIQHRKIKCSINGIKVLTYNKLGGQPNSISVSDGFTCTTPLNPTNFELYVI
jgi:hypothetical protein